MKNTKTYFFSGGGEFETGFHITQVVQELVEARDNLELLIGLYASALVWKVLGNQTQICCWATQVFYTETQWKFKVESSDRLLAFTDVCKHTHSCTQIHITPPPYTHVVVVINLVLKREAAPCTVLVFRPLQLLTHLGPSDVKIKPPALTSLT